MAKIAQVNLLPRRGTGSGYAAIGEYGVNRIEELQLPGPGGTIPYIRIHYDDGRWCDCPKHNLEAILYEA